MPQLEIVIPLWNEAANIPQLIAMLRKSRLIDQKILSVIFVNNGSLDNSLDLLERELKGDTWAKVLTLNQNENYGGGIYQGLMRTQSDWIGFIPGDLQVTSDAIEMIWDQLSKTFPERTFFKGKRTIRKDPLQTRIISVFYSALTRTILQLPVTDTNGLPKIFHRSLLSILPPNPMKTFMFDVQLMTCAFQNGWNFSEIPVTFHGRREGVSSWSKKRLEVYFKSFVSLFRLRFQARSLKVLQNSTPPGGYHGKY